MATPAAIIPLRALPGLGNWNVTRTRMLPWELPPNAPLRGTQKGTGGQTPRPKRRAPYGAKVDRGMGGPDGFAAGGRGREPSPGNQKKFSNRELESLTCSYGSRLKGNPHSKRSGPSGENHRMPKPHDVRTSNRLAA